MYEVFLRPDIVARKRIQPTKAAKQSVFSRPSAYALYSQHCLQCGLIIERRHRFKIEPPITNRPAQFDKRAGLVGVEAEASQRAYFRDGQSIWIRKGAHRIQRSRAEPPRQSIEQKNSHQHRQLLASD